MATVRPVHSPAAAPGLAQILDSDICLVGALTINSLTAGSVLFAGTGGAVSQDNGNLFWDNTNKRLGLGINAALTGRLHIVENAATAAQVISQAGAGNGITLTKSNAGAGRGIELTMGASTTAQGIYLSHSGSGVGASIVHSGTADALSVNCSAGATSGNGISVTMAAGAITSGMIVQAQGSGRGLSVIKSNAGAGEAAYLSMGATCTGTGLYLPHAGTGKGLDLALSNAGNSSDAIAVAHSGTGYGLNSNVACKLKNVIYPDINTAMQEPTGFPTAGAGGGTYTFNNVTRVFTHNPGPTTFTFYISGVLYTKTTLQTVTLPADTTGLYFIYYDATGTLTASATFPGFALPLVATVYWQTQNDTYMLGEERHGIVMDAATHSYLHSTIGTRYVSGLGLGAAFNTALLPISPPPAIDVASGVVNDEDIALSIAAQTTDNVVYTDSGTATGYFWDAAVTNYYHVSGGNLCYNNPGTGALVPTGSTNDRVAAWLFATNDRTTPIVALIGQRVDTTLNNARTNNTYETLMFGTLPFKEMKLLYRFILRNTATPTLEAIDDYRSVSNVPSGTYVATSHSSLTGLGNDDHLQYLLLAGRGGQTINDAITITGNVQLGDAGTDTLAIYPTSTTLYSQVGSAPAWLNSLFGPGVTVHPTGLITNVARVGGLPGGDMVIATLRGSDSAATDAGAVMLLGGDATASNYKGGWAMSFGGAGFGSGTGGNCLGFGGSGGATGTGGDAFLWSGAGGATSGASGVLSLATGSTTNGTSGDATLQTGNAATGTSGAIALLTGTGSVASGNISLNVGSAPTKGQIKIANGAGCSINVGGNNSSIISLGGGNTDTLNVYAYWATYQSYESITYNLPPAMGGALSVPSAGIVTKDAHTGGSPGSYVAAVTRGANTTTVGEKGGIAALVGGAGGAEGDGGPCVILGGVGGVADLAGDAGEGGPIIISGGIGGAASASYPASKGGWIGLIGNIGGAGSATQLAGRGSDIQIFGGPAGADGGGGGDRGGDITLTCGAGTGSGRGGNVTIDGGATVSGTAGSITIGGSTASAVNLGRAAITTTINGTLNVGGSNCGATVTGTNLTTLTDTSNADALHSHAGIATVSYTSGGVTQYDVVYASDVGTGMKVYPATAVGTNLIAAHVLGVAKTTQASGNPVVVVAAGEYTMHFDAIPGAATQGSDVFLSDGGTAGLVSLTAPTTSGHVSVRIGYLTEVNGTVNCKVMIHIGDTFVQP